MHRSSIFVYSVVFWLSFLVAPIGVLAATDCSQLGSQYRLATANDAVVKNGEIPAGTCYDPNDSAIGKNAEEAKQFLLTRYKPSAGGCSASTQTAQQSIDKLDSQFAINLAKMLKEAPMIINFISAYRSPIAQQCANPKVKNSNHTKGCAVDLQYAQSNCDSDTCKWVVKNAETYGLHIRMRYDPEWNHLEPKSCSGQSTGNVINDSPQPQSAYQRAVQGIQNYFNPPPPPQCPQGTVLMNGTCLPQQAQAYNQMTSPYSYAQPTSATTNGNTGTGSTGSGITIGSGTGGTGSSGTNIGSGVNISGLIDNTTKTPTSGTSTSAIDLINALANPTTTSATTATGTPIALNGSLGATSALQGTRNATTTSTLSATNTYALGTQASQTFVSQDLSKTPSNYTQNVSNGSTFALLENIKQILLTIISSLRPFGGTAPKVSTVTPGNQVTAFLR